MNIQLAPHRFVEGVTTVWHEHGPDVDIVMDLKNLTFAPGSIENIYSFHVLEHLFVEEIMSALQNWYKCLKTEGELFVVVDDFEQLARLFVGGDINIHDYNKNYTHPTQFTKENLTDYLLDTGFSTEGAIKVWYTDVPDLFTRRDTELVFSGKKV